MINHFNKYPLSISSRFKNDLWHYTKNSFDNSFKKDIGLGQIQRHMFVVIQVGQIKFNITNVDKSIKEKAHCVTYGAKAIHKDLVKKTLKSNTGFKKRITIIA